MPTNSTETIDRRVIKSKQALKDALISLMNQRDLKAISVTDIVKLANVNRGTFYKHYQYKEDILAEMADEVIQDLIISYREPYKYSKAIEVHQMNASAIKVFDHVKKYASFYSLIVKSNAFHGFTHRMSDVLKNLDLRELHGQYESQTINRELQASYHVYALLGMIFEWIHSGFHYNPEYMAEQLLEIIKTQTHSFFIEPS